MKRQLPAIACIVMVAASSILGGRKASTPAVVQEKPAGALSAFKVDTLRSPAPWTSLSVPDERKQFRFAIIADRTDAARPGAFESAMAKLNLLMPDFVINVGDLIQGYSTDTTVLSKEWKEVDDQIVTLRMPFFRVPGNHDVQNAVELAVWKKRYGADVYSFVYKNVLFLCLNSVDSGYGNLTAGQLKKVEKTIQENPSVGWTFVLMHMPLWNSDYKPEAGWARMRELLGNRPYTAFAGHYHQYTLQRERGRDHFTLAVTGGGSELRGPQYGEFDHVAWVTMTPTEPVIANIMLEGVQSKTIRTAEMRAAMDSIRTSGNWGVRPIFLEAATATEGKTAFVLRNPLPSDVFLKLDMKVTDPRASVTCATAACTVKAGSVVSIPITVSLKGPGVSTDHAVAAIHWSAVVGMADTLRLSGDTKVAFVRKLPLPKASKPIVCDGVLGEWTALPYECAKPMQVRKSAAKWRGPKDSRFSFGVCRDSTTLYIAAKVTDDTVVTPKEFSWDDDCMEIHLNCAPDSVRSVMGDPGEDPRNFAIAINAPAGDKDTALYFPWAMPKGTRCAAKRTPEGFSVEVAIPRASIDSVAGAGWRGVRLLCAYGDRDGGDVATIWWRPWADSPEWYPGAGEFALTK